MTFRSTRAAAALLFATGALAGCEGGLTSPFPSRGETDAFTPILTEEAFRAQVVGREVVYANGAVGSYGGDGTWSIADGERILGGGAWTWEGDRWCREGSTFEGPVTPACETVAVSGAGVRFTRDDGVQGALPFRI